MIRLLVLQGARQTNSVLMGGSTSMASKENGHGSI